MPTCHQCGGAVVEGGSFCQYCGTSVKASGSGPACPACGTGVPGGTAYCPNCGQRLMDVSMSTAAIALRPPAAAPPRTVGENARLTAVRRDGSDGESYQLAADQIDIGRTEGDLLFDDPHLAPRHARIARRGGQFVLTPLEARNGVYLRIHQPVEIGEGDQLLIGKQVLRFEVPSEAERSLRPAIEHGIVLFGTPLKAPWGRLRQLTAAGTARDVYHLTRNETTLGREQGDIIFSDDEFLSRRHAQISLRGGRVSFKDLGSSNGSYVRLRAPHALASGEMIRLGDELLRFELL